MEKSSYYLGMRVKGGVVDALTQSAVGVLLDDGGYVVMDWEKFVGYVA